MCRVDFGCTQLLNQQTVSWMPLSSLSLPLWRGFAAAFYNACSNSAGDSRRVSRWVSLSCFVELGMLLGSPPDPPGPMRAIDTPHQDHHHHYTPHTNHPLTRRHHHHRAAC